jgi:diaminopimelate decarboxylase
MNHFEYRDGVLHCEDVPLDAIAAEVGTPVYVYSTATLERHYRVFMAAFAPRKPLVAFAMKSNGNIAVIRTLTNLGAGVDTVSAGEIEKALAAGAAPDKIIFSGVGKTAEELAYAIDVGVHQINVESIAELDLLETIAAAKGKRPAIAIRVNPDVGAGGHAKIATGGADAKFGVSLADARALFLRAHAHPHLDAAGLAVHIGSQIMDLAPLEAAFRLIRSLAEDLAEAGCAPRVLDLGGGLGVPYFNHPDPPGPDEYAQMVERVFAGLDVALAFEPGRMIAGNAGVLVTRVVRIQERPDRRMLVLDAAMNDLIRPAMYDAFHDLVPVRANPAAERTPYDVVGPVCETGDTFARDRLLPPLAAGDLACFLTAGAYGASMASTYNARPLTPEVLVSGARWRIVRRRFTVEDQLALEALPEWL